MPFQNSWTIGNQGLHGDATWGTETRNRFRPAPEGYHREVRPCCGVDHSNDELTVWRS
jgi:hypothetical protein